MTRVSNRSLTALNSVAFAVHVFNAAVGLRLVSTGDPRVPVVQPLVEFIRNGTHGGDFLVPRPKTLFTTSILRPLVAVELITAAFHLVYLLQLHSADARRLVRRFVGGGGANPLRWFEYSITATLLSAFGGLNIGLNSFPYFLANLSSGVALQVIGFAIETLDARSARDRTLFYILWYQGSLLNITQVGVLLYQLFASKTHTNIFYFNVLPFSVLFNTFGFVARASFMKWSRFADDVYTEKAYIALSLSTKVAIFWLSFSTFRSLIEDRGFAPKTGVRWDVVRWTSASLPIACLVAYFAWTLQPSRAAPQGRVSLPRATPRRRQAFAATSEQQQRQLGRIEEEPSPRGVDARVAAYDRLSL